MRTFVTFGQNHTHAVNGKTLDKDCVAVIKSESAEEGRALAFEFFGRQFCMEHPEPYWDEESLAYYPRGYIEVN